MIRKEKNGYTWLEFQQLQAYPHIRHALFLRQGGFDANNPSHLEKARLLIGLPPFIVPKQTHGTVCINASVVEGTPSCDALATNKIGVGLTIKHGDCQPALFYDIKSEALALVHSGWRGSVQNIYRKTITWMKEEFGTDPTQLLVGIGPSLGPDHAEFIHYKEELPSIFWPFQSTPNYFDFWKISTQQLIECGVLESHIEIAGLDTYAKAEDYHSYRRDGTKMRHVLMAAITASS